MIQSSRVRSVTTASRIAAVSIPTYRYRKAYVALTSSSTTTLQGRLDKTNAMAPSAENGRTTQPNWPRSSKASPSALSSPPDPFTSSRTANTASPYLWCRKGATTNILKRATSCPRNFRTSASSERCSTPSGTSTVLYSSSKWPLTPVVKTNITSATISLTNSAISAYGTFEETHD